MLVKTYTGAVFGILSTQVRVEVQATEGIGYMLGGLPDNAVKESQQRILASLLSLGYRWPGRRLVINLAPADLRKEGSSYDLPIAIGILGANEQINPGELEHFMLAGELSLDGILQPVTGILPMTMKARKEGFKGVIVPLANAREAAVVDGIDVFGMESLKDVVEFFTGEKRPEPVRIDLAAEFARHPGHLEPDFSEVRGQENVKRALEVAVGGNHNVLLVGAPGSGKTMLAQRLPGIMPSLTLAEALETTRIHSVAGKLGKNVSLITRRPFRSPHHTISDIALVGGGTSPKPGEISLAHHGVLFLDELPEFKRTVLEVLRQPLEDRVIHISRARFAVQYPASFMLVASMNPCPCGFFNHPEKKCGCQPAAVQKYLGRISGPLLDRIDLHIEVVPVGFDKLTDLPVAETSSQIRDRIQKARDIQIRRFEGIPGMYTNSQMSPRLMRKFIRLDDPGRTVLKQAMERLRLSARAYDRILKVSRTIADLDGSPEVKVCHIAEAVNYRTLDRDFWSA